MYNLLGPHCNSSPGGVPELVQRWKPAVCCVLDPGPVWRGPAAATRTRFVWRYFEREQPDWNQNLDPVAEARKWVARRLGQMLQLSGCGGYFQGYNEPTIASAEAMTRYAQFEAERLALLSRHGLRGGVGSFAVGNPPELSWWAAFRPALEAAVTHGGVLLLHEYNYPTLRGDARHDPAWLSLRHRLVYTMFPERLQVPLIITECGRDSIFAGDDNGGWRGHLSSGDYLESLRWYDRELMADPYVLGACVYCVAAESWQWSYYDILPDVAEAMVARTTPEYRAVTVPKARSKRGVDVSVWQGAINWPKVASSGIGFALIRASVGAKPDSRWRANLAGARKAGLTVEPYHFLTTDVSISDQAARLLTIGTSWTTLWVDVEYEARTKGGPGEAAVREMVDRLQQAGARPGIYTSMSMWRRLGHSAWAGHLPLWVADWNPAYAGKPRLPAGWDTWKYQQTTSAGTVPGIAGRVDLDIANE